MPMQVQRHRFEVHGAGLSVLEVGADARERPTARPPLIMLHGMRDVAASLLPVAAPLSERFRVLLPELRGHGDSDQPGCYGMDHFLFDLYQLMGLLEIDSAAMFGHSLGGQILARFAALYPKRVRAAVLVEGLGPPERPGEGDEAREIAGHAARLLQLLAIPQRQRPLPGLDFASERLIANNPRLGPTAAAALAQQATRLDAQGQLVWAFDPRVGNVFLGVGGEDPKRYWRHVTCPTLIVSGDLADEYWRAQIPLQWTGRFAPGELSARVRMFPNAEHLALAGAGHMVHYDQPRELSQAVAEFLEKHP